MFLRPIITEKSIGSAKSLNEYTFAVDRFVTKSQIKKRVEENFKVKVIDVKTKIVRGKEKRVGKKSKTVQMSDTKRAIVRLVRGNTISLFEIKEAKK